MNIPANLPRIAESLKVDRRNLLQSSTPAVQPEMDSLKLGAPYLEPERYPNLSQVAAETRVRSLGPDPSQFSWENGLEISGNAILGIPGASLRIFAGNGENRGLHLSIPVAGRTHQLQLDPSNIRQFGDSPLDLFLDGQQLSVSLSENHVTVFSSQADYNLTASFGEKLQRLTLATTENTSQGRQVSHQVSLRAENGVPASASVAWSERGLQSFDSEHHSIGPQGPRSQKTDFTGKLPSPPLDWDRLQRSANQVEQLAQSLVRG